MKNVKFWPRHGFQLVPTPELDLGSNDQLLQDSRDFDRQIFLPAIVSGNGDIACCNKSCYISIRLLMIVRRLASDKFLSEVASIEHI